MDNIAQTLTQNQHIARPEGPFYKGKIMP